ncbi:phosphoheptose isomerase, partial [Micromonospora sp. GCM10011541]
ARDTGLRCWAFTGPTPNPLADVCEETLAIDSPESQVVQELHLVATHVLCEYVERVLPAALAARAQPVSAAPARPTPVRTGVEVVLADEAPEAEARGGGRA